MEILKFIGSSFGYILSAIALLTMIINYMRRKLGGFVKKETKSDDYAERMERLEKLLEEHIADNKAFNEQVLQMLKHQGHASKQTLAHIIENTYHMKKSVKRLDPIELKRITNAYAVYHGELDGNSYITQIYEEMIDDWEHE